MEVMLWLKFTPLKVFYVDSLYPHYQSQQYGVDDQGTRCKVSNVSDLSRKLRSLGYHDTECAVSDISEFPREQHQFGLGDLICMTFAVVRPSLFRSCNLCIMIMNCRVLQREWVTARVLAVTNTTRGGWIKRPDQPCGTYGFEYLV